MGKTGKEGSFVKVTTSSNIFEGIIMPNPDKEMLFLKLENGYNLGIKKNEIKNIRKIGTAQQSKQPKQKAQMQKLEKKPGLKTISILHTGGTIASRVDYETGAVISKFTPEEIILQFPELRTLANIKSRLVRQMFSEDMRFAHYNLLAKEIAKEIKEGSSGIIITHGTDTIPYTAAALDFALENINIPVIIVGAQRSSDRGSSDAAMNLICAAKFITNTDFTGVAICMHENMKDEACLILPACKTRKIHTSRRDAFRVINGIPIARVYYKEDKIEIIDNARFKKKEGKELKLSLFKEHLKIGILKSHPNMFAEEVNFCKGFDGLIIEGFGLAGNFPINKIDEYTKEHTKIYEVLKKLANKIPVVVTSQCIFGRVNMDVYSTGRKMQEANIMGNLLDITAETAFIKLAWLLSNHPKQVKELFGKNLRGEISERTGEDFLE